MHEKQMSASQPLVFLYMLFYHKLESTLLRSFLDLLRKSAFSLKHA